jgi:hypothetical protein
MIKKYSLTNNILGWLMFVVSAIVYLLTIEPTTSLWDCGEFITAAYKLQVGHPPGAPLFMLIGRFFSLFTNDVAQVAKMVNAMSALCSALTITFLFWSITHLAKKLIEKLNDSISNAQYIAIFGSGIIGALSFTFSDTFWFSAVEGEVYAMSSLFTAVVFWAILKWEDTAHEPHSDKWLIIIAYMMGLSIGVHLLNLLVIPAIVFVYYFKKFETTRKGIIYSSIISILAIAFVMYGMIQGSVKVASWIELFTVNTMGMAISSGLVIYLIILIAVLGLGLFFTTKEEKPLLNASLVTIAAMLVGIPFIENSILIAIVLIPSIFGLSYLVSKKKVSILNTAMLIVTVIMLGYSSYAMIVIRSSANPPMDENNPENVFALLAYLNREQYGDRPLFKGEYYNAPIDPQNPYADGKVSYFRTGDRYSSDVQTNYNYDSRFTTIFPRMYSSNANHVEAYKVWGDVKGTPIRINEGGEAKVIYKPTFAENLRFFFKYQVGHMYMRYFMWNFVGRQNDEQGHGEITNGNWISGINFIDSMFIGNQDKITERAKNHPSRNTYYFLPLLLGMIGLVFQLKKSSKDFTVVTLLFFFTGLAIVIYLNQTPYQPRERDYAYAGSFYAFAIWIGLGVLGIYEGLKKYAPTNISAIGATAVSLVVPVLMAAENWDDHDRSGRYTARDFARNYLETCEPNSMIFTNGDNDTFPLWYAQEVEGIRTDVRVVCLPLFSTDWYVDQMKRKAYQSEPLPISFTHDQYVQGTRDYLPVYERFTEPVELTQLIEFIASDSEQTKVTVGNNKKLNYIPAKNIRFIVDSSKVIEAGIERPEDAHKIAKEIPINLKSSYILKNELMILDMLSKNAWNRPMYYSSMGTRESFGLDNYMVNEGFAYRLSPIRSNAPRVDTEKMYKNLMEKYTWGRMNEDDVHTCHFTIRTMRVIGIRQMFNDLASELIKEGKKDSAYAVVNRLVELMPFEKIPYDFFAISTADVYYRLGKIEQANEIILQYANECIEELKYYKSVQPKFRRTVSDDEQRSMAILDRIITKAKQFNQNELVDNLNEQWAILMQ